MEIAGYEIKDQYLIAGAGALVIGGILLSRRGTSDGEIATLQPAEGLSWGDIFGIGDTGNLIGPGGPPGEPGPPGPPAPAPPTDGVEPPPTEQDRGDQKPPGRGGRKCKTNRDCPDGKRCRDGRCEDAPNRPDDGKPGKRGDRNRNDRPNMPDTNDDRFTDPRLDRPKDRERRNEGRNRVDNGRGREETREERREERQAERQDDRNQRRVTTNPVSGGIKNPERERRKEKERNDRERNQGRAKANADAGNVKTGNIDKGANVTINADGGRAIERDRKNQKEENDRQRQQKQKQGANRPAVQRKGRGGYGVPGLNTDGYGRLDGRGGTADGTIRENISPGSTIGGFMPMPQALSGANESRTIQEGETLKGLSQRTYGLQNFWPRIVQLNSDLDLPEGFIPAGTRFRV